MRSALDMLNLTLRAMMELGIIAALAYWGHQAGNSRLTAIGLAILLPLIGFGFWGLVDFRNAGPLAEALRLLQELAISAVAALALFKGHVVKKLFRYLMFVILIGGVLMVMKVLVRAVLVIVIFAGILFSAAGRLDWAEAWTLIGLYAISLLGMMLWGAVHAPDLMRERSMIAKNVKGWDRVINKAYGLAFVALLIVAGLDAGRFGWSITPSIIHWIGGSGCAAAGYIVWLTIKENAYLSRWARIQDDRRQKVVSTGPYRVVRHPMYAAILLFVISTPLLLGSWWALIPAGVVITLYILRTGLEDNMLHDELEGYGEYTKMVPFRLLPGIW